MVWVRFFSPNHDIAVLIAVSPPGTGLLAIGKACASLFFANMFVRTLRLT